MLNISNDTPGLEAIHVLGWKKLETRQANSSQRRQIYKFLNDLGPSSLAVLFLPKRNYRDLRGSANTRVLPTTRSIMISGVMQIQESYQHGKNSIKKLIQSIFIFI